MANKDESPTKEIYEMLSRAYGYFNKELFNGRLPACVITLQDSKTVAGSYINNAWASSRAGSLVDEIVINPSYLTKETLKEFFQTVVHEMTHLEQQHFGKPGRGGYHNLEWAHMMISKGLMPSDTGMPGGRRTGYRMADYAIEGGRFESVYQGLFDKNSHTYTPTPNRQSKGTTNAKRASKTKFTCPKCDQRAWAKPTATLVCGHDGEHMMTNQNTKRENHDN